MVLTCVVVHQTPQMKDYHHITAAWILGVEGSLGGPAFEELGVGEMALTKYNQCSPFYTAAHIAYPNVCAVCLRIPISGV